MVQWIQVAVHFLLFFEQLCTLEASIISRINEIFFDWLNVSMVLDVRFTVQKTCESKKQFLLNLIQEQNVFTLLFGILF